MDIRTVSPQERLAIHRLQALAFNFTLDEKEIQDKIRKGEYPTDGVYGAIDDSGHPVAGMEAMAMTMWFDGQKVPMTGIGGVVTAPNCRRGGYIKKIFRKVLDDSYDNGVVFSHLYPFSYEYYRKFGYEQIGSAARYLLTIGPARGMPQTGRIVEYDPDSASDELTQALKAVYERYASRHNVMLSRTDKDWDKIFKLTFTGGPRIYYLENREGIPSAWVKIEKVKAQLVVRDSAWSDDEGMTGILQFLGMYEGESEKLSMVLSPEFIPELYWPNVYEVKRDGVYWLGMSRVVNVRRALEMLRMPMGRGCVVLKVHDEFLPQNNGCYAVEYTDGAGQVSLTDKTPDIELSEKTLAQLLLGVYPPHAVLVRAGVPQNQDTTELCSLFPGKNVMLQDYF